jgi:tRNA(Ile)-lysidine synthase
VRPLERKVADFVQSRALFARGGRILLAVSGGADSIALLHVMFRLRRKGIVADDLLCAHLHHGLRGGASDGDEAFVVEQAKELGLPIVARSLDVQRHACENRLSTETAARQLRLASLVEIARQEGCSSVALGHQMNDNAETVLQRLERGTGIRGLGGIRPSRLAGEGLAFVRPLLCCSRQEIVQYLRGRNLSWREDHTNADCTYTRNRIRHRLLPLLQEASEGSLMEELAGLSGSAARLHDKIAWEASTAIERHARLSGSRATIHAKALAALPEAVAVEVLRQLLTRMGLGERDLTRRHYRGVVELARRDQAKTRMSLPGDFCALREHDAIVLRKPIPHGQERLDPLEVRVPGTTDFGPYRIEAQILDRTRIEKRAIADKDPFREYLDFDRVHLPLVARTRRPGDHFVPLGQRSEKKLGKFLTAAKVPDDRRRRTFLIEDTEIILWLCPIRISDRAKVTEQTSIVLDLTVTEL